MAFASPKLMSGAAGAVVLTAVHQFAKSVTDEAPQIDRLGRRVVASAMLRVGLPLPQRKGMQAIALVGDLLSNTAYYSLVGIGPSRNVWTRGMVLGALAGAGVLAIPPLVKLGTEPQAKTTQRALMSFGWYFLGGLAAAATFQALRPGSRAAQLPR